MFRYGLLRYSQDWCTNFFIRINKNHNNNNPHNDKNDHHNNHHQSWYAIIYYGPWSMGSANYKPLYLGLAQVFIPTNQIVFAFHSLLHVYNESTIMKLFDATSFFHENDSHNRNTKDERIWS